MSNKVAQIFEEFKRFLIKPQVGVLGFITAVVAGNSTYQLIKSLVEGILIPVIGLIIRIKHLNNFQIGEFQIGGFMVDLITWLIIIVVLFFFIEYLLKSLVPDQEEQYRNKYAQISFDAPLNDKKI